MDTTSRTDVAGFLERHAGAAQGELGMQVVADTTAPR